MTKIKKYPVKLLSGEIDFLVKLLEENKELLEIECTLVESDEARKAIVLEFIKNDNILIAANLARGLIK